MSLFIMYYIYFDLLLCIVSDMIDPYSNTPPINYKPCPGLPALFRRPGKRLLVAVVCIILIFLLYFCLFK